METRPKPKASKGLRIASGCSTLDEFTGVFRKFCSANGIFIPTKAPRKSGFETRFAITLKDGKPVMRGAGKVTSSFEDANNAFARPGMVIEFTKLDTMGRILLDELNAVTGTGIKAAPAAEQNFEVPTVVTDPDRDMLAAARRSGEMVAVVPPSEESGSADEANESSSKSPGPQRAEGSRNILPANPFGELTASTLEAFVDCTLYEETGEVDIAGLVAELGASTGFIPNFAEETGDGMAAFDSAPDAVENEEARALAAAQVAEDKRPKYVPRDVPRAPKLPGVATPAPTPPPPPSSPEASSSPEAAAPMFQPAMESVPSIVASDADSPVQQYGVLVPQVVAPEPNELVDEQVPAVVHALSAEPEASYGMPTSAPSDGREFTGAEEARFGMGLSRGRSFITRNQVIAIALLCLVAGLGFGMLFGGGKSHKSAANEVAAPSEAKVQAKTLAPLPDARPPEQGSVAHAESADASPPEPIAPVDAGLPDEIETVELAATLSSGAAGSDCVVLLDIVPKDGEVRIGGVLRTSEQSEMQVPCGEQEVTIVHPRYQAYRAPFLVTAGETATLRARLSRPAVFIQISSFPSKAKVTINSRSVGKTPGKFKVSAFETATVKIASPGYQEYTKKFYPKKNTALSVGLKKVPTKKKSSVKKSTTTKRTSTKR